jgi:hypothetical protein
MDLLLIFTGAGAISCFEGYESEKRLSFIVNLEEGVSE